MTSATMGGMEAVVMRKPRQKSTGKPSSGIDHSRPNHRMAPPKARAKSQTTQPSRNVMDLIRSRRVIGALIKIKSLELPPRIASARQSLTRSPPLA